MAPYLLIQVFASLLHQHSYQKRIYTNIRNTFTVCECLEPYRNFGPTGLECADMPETGLKSEIRVGFSLNCIRGCIEDY